METMPKHWMRRNNKGYRVIGLYFSNTLEFFYRHNRGRVKKSATGRGYYRVYKVGKLANLY